MAEALSRTLRVATLLQTTPGLTAGGIAEHLGVQKRTAFRHLATLRRAGFQIQSLPGGGYRLGRASYLTGLELTVEEAGVLALVSMAGTATPRPLDEPLASALQKIHAALPAALVEGLGADAEAMSIRLAPSEHGDAADVFRVVREAHGQRRVLDCVYEAPNRKPEAFQFSPYRLQFERRAWYATGRHHGRGDPNRPDDLAAVRNLKLSRFVVAKPTEVSFRIPRSFSMERHRGAAWRMIRGDGVRRIRLRFDATVAAAVTETLWHPSQESEELEDGSAVLTFEVDGIEEILWWILGYGRHVVVEEPEELWKRVAAELSAAAAAYVANDTER